MTNISEIVEAAEKASEIQRYRALDLLNGKESTLLEIEPYVTLREVARQTGISTTTLWRWRVPGHALGGRRRFRVSEVMKFLEEKK